MTKTSKLKQQTRARARKTGESYSTSRRSVLEARARKTAARKKATPHGAAGEQADKPQTAKSKKAGTIVSSAKCVEKTGHGLAHWFGVLDAFGAADKGHTAAAKHLRDDHPSVSAWYAQSITVAYERERGLRDVHQTCAGEYQVAVSRVMPVSVHAVSTVLSQANQRRRWLEAAPATVQSLVSVVFGEGKRWTRKGEGQARITLDHGGTKVVLELRGKADGRCTAVATSHKLADSDAVEQQRALWRATLDSLRDHLRKPTA